jgi:hypothetical protein
MPQPKKQFPGDTSSAIGNHGEVLPATEPSALIVSEAPAVEAAEELPSSVDITVPQEISDQSLEAAGAATVEDLPVAEADPAVAPVVSAAEEPQVPEAPAETVIEEQESLMESSPHELSANE